MVISNWVRRVHERARFLEQYNANLLKALAKRHRVGGGNTPMDAARAAKRIKGVVTSTIVYRRNKRYMPADEEELQLAEDDGVAFRELLTPVRLENGKLVCRVCTLGAPDASGRPSSVETDEMVALPCSLLISAIGEKIDAKDFNENGIVLSDPGKRRDQRKNAGDQRTNVFVIATRTAARNTVV